MNYDSILSSRIQEVKPSGIRKFFDILEEMKDAISLGIGEPDFVLALPLPMAAMRRASLRMRPLRLRPSKLCACSCFFFLPCSFFRAVQPAVSVAPVR